MATIFYLPYCSILSNQPLLALSPTPYAVLSCPGSFASSCHSSSRTSLFLQSLHPHCFHLNLWFSDTNYPVFSSNSLDSFSRLLHLLFCSRTNLSRLVYPKHWLSLATYSTFQFLLIFSINRESVLEDMSFGRAASCWGIFLVLRLISLNYLSYS